MRFSYSSALMGAVLALGLYAASDARAAGKASTAALRIGCEDEAEGAKVFINGKLRGECPIDGIL